MAGCQTMLAAACLAARPRRPSRRRFTLLELAIAVLLLAMLTASLFAAATAIAGSWERLSKERARFAELLTVDRTLDGLLVNVVPFLWPDQQQEGGPRLLFEGRRDQLGFATVVQPHDTTSGGLRFVHLFVRDGTLIAAYQPRPVLVLDRPLEATRESLLASQVERLDCFYADLSPQGDWQWLDEWNPSGERNELPLAIQVTVTWKDGRVESWLRRTAGSSQYERYGNWQPAVDQ